jgi:biopolymer transport protein ExbD
MAMTIGRSEGQSCSSINMTPLIDVMLVLLIIFISPFRARRTRSRSTIPSRLRLRRPGWTPSICRSISTGR